MLTIRKAEERGHADHGWLNSHHTFSFANYHDPRHMGFRALRVINDDRVAPGGGFGTHPHNNMEIISYVLEGALEHKDSMGTGSTIRPGDVQRMSAGTGVAHSEFNASKKDPVHFLQIWIQPNQTGVKPSYAQKTFSEDSKRGKLLLVASPDGRDGSISIHADANVFVTIVNAGERLEHVVPEGRHAWVHLARGRANVGGEALKEGDAASTSAAGKIAIEGVDQAEIIVFDLA